MINERRQHPRYHAQMPVSMVLPDGLRMKANTLDISKTGVRLATNQRLPAGIQVRLELIGDNSGEAITLNASTLHSKELGDEGQGYGIGLNFEDAPSRYKSLLMSLNPLARLN